MYRGRVDNSLYETIYKTVLLLSNKNILMKPQTVKNVLGVTSFLCVI